MLGIVFYFAYGTWVTLSPSDDGTVAEGVAPYRPATMEWIAKHEDEGTRAVAAFPGHNGSVLHQWRRLWQRVRNNAEAGLPEASCGDGYPSHSLPGCRMVEDVVGSGVGANVNCHHLN